MTIPERLRNLRNQITTWCSGPHILAFVPALCLGAFWLGGEMALMLVALGLPLFIVVVNPSALQGSKAERSPVRGIVPRDAFLSRIENVNLTARQDGLQSVVMVIELADYDVLAERHGHTAAELVMQRIGDRIEGLLRDNDSVAQLGDRRVAICVSPVQRLDLESCIQLAGRLQTAVEEPVSVSELAIYATAAVGFCMLTRAPGSTGKAWFEAAETALNEARRRAPNAIRAYSNEMRKVAAARQSMREEAREALENGQIQPWFQPQLNTDTGRISGFEALARWIHPENGVVPPADFLTVLEESGLLDRLGEVMLYNALTALKTWDASGIVVPCIGVNFSGSELNNPKLVDKISWELDRFDLSADRLAVEVLETVVSSSPSDVVSRNVKALEELGCRIDLDDFGTGHASIAAIRRFNVTRIKIDRSFVSKCDRDPDQRTLLSAILTLAERLEIETLAEGVETVGEHALLAQLGCNHVQGFGIGRPMPFEKTLEWAHQHEAKLSAPPSIPGRQGGKR